MRLTFTEEQNDLRAAVRRLLADNWSSTRRRAFLDEGEPYDRQVWSAMAQQLGVVGLTVPEVHGGVGAGFAEHAIVLEEIGRRLVAAPYLSSAVVAPAVLAHAPDEVQQRWLPGIAQGSVIGAFAHTEPDGRWRPERLATSATPTGSGWIISGTKEFVVDGAQADVILASAADENGDPVLLAVDAAAPTVTVHDRPTLDLTRRLAGVTFDQADAALIASGDRAVAVLDRALDLTAAGLACEQAGGAAAALEMTVDYVKVREQFDVPIGSFQAVKFACADMLLQVEAARSAAYYAAAATTTAADDQAIAVAVAKAVCSEAFSAVTGSAIQLHGGVGYTWEHDAHLYFKRAKASELLGGSPDDHRDRLAHLLGV